VVGNKLVICDFSSPRLGLGNLGASLPAIISMGGNAAAGIVPGVLAAGAGAGGTILGLAPTLAVPIIGAAIAGVTLAVTLFLNRNAQYFSEEKATTDIVNQAEVLMKQNLKAWQGLATTDKTILNQQQAITNFNTIWGEVVQACSSSAYSQGKDSTGQSPGTRCVTDRQRGGRWDWFSYYYDPIANDQIYVPPVATVLSNIPSDISSSVSSIFGGSTSGSGAGSISSLIPLLLLGIGAWALSELT
jgi:hypothetical protein